MFKVLTFLSLIGVGSAVKLGSCNACYYGSGTVDCSDPNNWTTETTNSNGNDCEVCYKEIGTQVFLLLFFEKIHNYYFFFIL